MSTPSPMKLLEKESPISPMIPTQLDFDMAWMQISNDAIEISAALSKEVELEFFELGDVKKEEIMISEKEFHL